MDKRVTPTKRVTSPTCAPKQEASLDRTELEDVIVSTGACNHEAGSSILNSLKPFHDMK